MVTIKSILRSVNDRPAKRRRRNAEDRGRRVRRSPEEARLLILDAAERVFGDKGPDAAGLKDVARAAGVSHGLVTHYFGTYSALVEATMERVVDRARAAIVTRLAELDEPTPEQLLTTYFHVIQQPPLGRLFAWLALSGRLAEESFFARRVQGPRQVADVLEARLRARMPDDSRFDRTELDYILALVLSVGIGEGASQGMFWEGLGRKQADEQPAFRSWLAELIRQRLVTAFGFDVNLGRAVDEG